MPGCKCGHIVRSIPYGLLTCTINRNVGNHEPSHNCNNQPLVSRILRFTINLIPRVGNLSAVWYVPGLFWESSSTTIAAPNNRALVFWVVMCKSCQTSYRHSFPPDSAPSPLAVMCPGIKPNQPSSAALFSAMKRLHTPIDHVFMMPPRRCLSFDYDGEIDAHSPTHQLHCF